MIALYGSDTYFFDLWKKKRRKRYIEISNLRFGNLKIYKLGKQIY